MFSTVQVGKATRAIADHLVDKGHLGGLSGLFPFL